MASDTTLKAQFTETGTPLEPFLAPGIQPGSFIGIGAADPQYNPGTEEYALRSNDQYKAVNRRVFELFNNTEAPLVPGVAGAPGYKLSTPETEQFVRDIRGGLPEGKNSTEDAAWYALNVMRPQSIHDAKYVFGALRPIIEQKIKEAQQAGGSFYPDELTEEQVIDLAKQAGISPFIVNKLIAEQGEITSRKATRTYTMGHLKPMIDNLDIESKWGEVVFNDPKTHLYGLTGQARRDAFLAMARWKEKHGVSLLGGMLEGVGTLAIEGAYATGGFIEGSIGTVVAAGTLGNVMMKDGRYVLSDLWLQKSQEEKDEANRVLQTAHELAKKYAPEFAEAMNAEGLSEEQRYGNAVAVLENRFGEFADPNDIETFRKLSELKEQGAFRPGESWERLANFGEGVLNAVPSMVKLMNASTDPNSFFFRSEANLKKGMYSDDKFGYLPSLIAGTFAQTFAITNAQYEAWYKGTDTYKEMTAEDLDRNIDLWIENYKQLQGDGESIAGFFYDKSAQLTKALGLETLSGVLSEGAKAAKGIMQEERLIQAGALADPVLVVMGSLKLLGVGAKAAAASKQLQTVTAGLREVSAEAATLRASANTTSKVFDAAVADLRVKLEAAIPGAKFTDDDIIGLAIGDRKSRFGQSASAQRIRTDIGRTISKNKSLSERVKKLTSQLDELPDDVAGIEKLRSRPVGGAVIAGAGYATQGASNVATTLANFLDEEYHTLQGNSRRRLLARGARFVLSGQGMAGGSRTFGVFAGATYLAGGDFLGAAIVGGVGVGVNQVLRPEFLRQFGAGAAQAARIQKVVGQNISAGRRYGESSFLRGAIDLEKQATELQKKVVRVPGKPLTAAEQAMVDQANMLVDDATKLRSMHASGLEDFLRNAGTVAWDDFKAGLTGGFIAALNDSDAFGAGAGMGMGFSGVLRAVNRAYQLFPKPAEPVYARSVLGDVATIVAESKDPAQRGYILEFLAKAGDDEAAQIQRAGIIRDLHMSTRGRVKFVKSGEFEAATILTASPEAEARIIMAEAAVVDPTGGPKAQAYVKERTAALAEARAATNRVTSLTDDSNTNKARILQMKQSLQGMDRQIAEQQKIVDAERIDWKDTKTVDANRIKLDRMLQARSELEANLKVADDQQLLIDGDLSEAKGKAKVEAPMRPYEQRALPDGSTVRSASNAFYIVDGPQGKNVYVNIDTVDNIGAISDGWHALLSDSAVESLMPEMVNMMWGNQAGGTRMAVKPEVTQAILDAYMADMSPEQAAKYKADLDAGKKLYYDTKGKDTSGLVEPTREAMTWILSAMDLDKRVGYRPGLSTREGAAASVDGRSWATVKKTLFGDRTLGDNVEKGLKNLLDPTWGLFARNHAENILGQLQQAGMRFVESGDGTLRGYFFNSNNEIIRSPVLDKFYDKVISLTGGKGSLRVRPVNLYDPLIPLDQRIEFIKRNGMDWALNEKGDGILPPLEAAQKADGFARAIEDTLNGVPEDQRGMQVYTDDAGRPVRTGIPSPAELAAIAADPRIPATYKENLLTIMRTLGSGESKAVLSAEYSNVFSMNVDNVTEHRLRIGKDIAGKTETRNIIPLAFTMGEAPIYDAKGKKVRVPGPDGKMMDATQRVIRVHGFDINAFTNSKNHAFQQGLFILDDAGKRTYLKDPKGNQYTAAYINELFGSEANFMNKATLWMQRYYAHGPLDPNSPTPRQPNGSPREVNPVSAEVLNPLDPEKGAAMRDALRAIFGLESGKKRLGWVTENRTTNTANGMLTRGTNFPLTDFRLDQFGPLKANGQSMFIDQIGVTSGQYVMSLKGWGSTKIQPIAGQAGAVMRTIVEVGDGKFLPGHELSVTEVRTHPTLPDVKLFIGTTTIAGSKPLKTLAYTLGDGRIVEASTSNEATALKELRKKLIEREDAAYIDTILGEWRYNRDKPLEGTLAPKVESKGEVKMYEPVGTAQDFVSTLEGLYRVNGRDMPPSVRAIISEVGLDAAVASGDSAEKIIAKMVTYADNRKNFNSTGDKYRHALGVLKEAQDMVKQKSYGQRAAYNVPTRTLSMDSIRDTFGLTKERGTAQANIDNRLADGFFEVSKQFAPDQFTNNKQYLEAVIDKLQEQMNAAENLESVDAYKAEKARIEPLMDAAERALGRLKNQMPELWAEQPKAGGKPAAAPVFSFESGSVSSHGNAELSSRGFLSSISAGMNIPKNAKISKGKKPAPGYPEGAGVYDDTMTLIIGGEEIGTVTYNSTPGDNGATILGIEIKDKHRGKKYSNILYAELDEVFKRNGVTEVTGAIHNEDYTPVKTRESVWGVGSTTPSYNELRSTGAEIPEVTTKVTPYTESQRRLISEIESLASQGKSGTPEFKQKLSELNQSKEATPEQPAGRDVQPRAGGSYTPGDEKLFVSEKLRDSQLTEGTTRDAPYMTPEEIAATREFRVGPDGKITRVTGKQKSEYDRWRQRYEAIIKKRQQEAKAAATAAERERRIFFAEQNRRAQIEIDSEEQLAAQSRKRAQEIAARDAKEAARLQKEADQAQARADALRLNFERGMDAARAAADIKRVETNRLIEVALSSEQPLIAPGLLLVESNRLTVQPVRMAVATDTVRKPSVTTRTGIVYLKNLAGFEGQTQGHQQAFFNYLFAEQIGKGKAIATEAFRGPMAAQQGINLLNSRVWVAQNSGARLVRLYKNADKAAGKDLVTYKVYGANGMLIKQANDAQDAVEAIENLERRFINTVKQPLGPLREEDIGGVMNQITSAYLTQPASGRPRGNMPEKESKAMQVENFQRYLPAQPRR